MTSSTAGCAGYFDSFFAGMPLTSVQALTLQYVLVESEKRDVFQKDLEEFLEIKGSSVTSLLNNLERNGYLRREPLAEDARYKRLVPTKEAYSLRGEVDRRVMGLHARGVRWAGGRGAGLLPVRGGTDVQNASK